MTSVDVQRKALFRATKISAQRAANTKNSRALFERMILPDGNDVPFTTLVLDYSKKYTKYLPPVGGSKYRRLFYRHSVRSALFHRDELLRLRHIKAVYPLFNMINIAMFHGVHRRNEFVKRQKAFNPGKHHILNPLPSIEPQKTFPRTFIATTPTGGHKLLPLTEEELNKPIELPNFLQSDPVSTEEVGDGFVAIRLTADEIHRRKAEKEFIDRRNEILERGQVMVPGNVPDFHRMLNDETSEDEEEAIGELLKQIQYDEEVDRVNNALKHPLLRGADAGGY